MTQSTDAAPTPITEPIPLVPDLAGCPYDAYAQLRADGGVHQAVMAEGLPVWVVSRYQDVKALLADPRMSMNARTAGRGYPGFRFPPALNEHLMNVDAQDHARLRRLVGKAFTPRRVEALRESVQRTVDDLLDTIAPNGRSDLLTDLAVPLPIAVICALLGINAHDGAVFRSFTTALMDPSDQARTARPGRVESLHRVLVELVARKRAEPADDLLSAMIEARDGGDRLTENELTSLAFLILWAGFETTVYLITTGIHLLLTHPHAATLVRAQHSPHTPAMTAAVEEIIRLEGPLLTSIRRFPLQDIQVSGRLIPAGSTVLLALGSANRDPHAIAYPDRLDPTREPNAHLGFGHGPHYCLGASLARLEVRTALWSLLTRFPDLEIEHQPLTWKPDYRQHALTALPVTFTPQPTG